MSLLVGHTTSAVSVTVECGVVCNKIHFLNSNSNISETGTHWSHLVDQPRSHLPDSTIPMPFFSASIPKEAYGFGFTGWLY